MSICPDDEELAVLAEGNLTGAARQRLIEHLSRCESCYRTFAQTLGTLQQQRTKRRRKWLWFGVPPLALAASLALVFLKTAFFPSQQSPFSLTMLDRLGSVIQPSQFSDPRMSHRGRKDEPSQGVQGAFDAGFSMCFLVISIEANARENALTALNNLQAGLGADKKIPERISLMEKVLRGSDRIGEWRKEVISLAAEMEQHFEARDLPFYRLGEWCALSRAVLLSSSPEAMQRHFKENQQPELLAVLTTDSRLPEEARAGLDQILSSFQRAEDMESAWFEIKSGLETVIETMKSSQHN